MTGANSLSLSLAAPSPRNRPEEPSRPEAAFEELVQTRGQAPEPPAPTQDAPTTQAPAETDLPTGDPPPASCAIGAQESLDPRTSLLVAGIVRLPHELERLARFDPTAAAMLELSTRSGAGTSSVPGAATHQEPVQTPRPQPPASSRSDRAPRSPTVETPARGLDDGPSPPVTSGPPNVVGPSNQPGEGERFEPEPRHEPRRPAAMPAPTLRADTSIAAAPPPSRAAGGSAATAGSTPLSRIGGAVLGEVRGVTHAVGRKEVVASRPNPSVEAQVARGLQAALKARGGAVTLRLSPESLGEVRIQLKVVERGVALRIEAASEAARRLLSDGMPALRSALEDQGLRIDRMEVACPRNTGDDGATEGLEKKGPGSHDAAGREAGGREEGLGKRGGAQAGQDLVDRGRRRPGEVGGAEPDGGAGGQQNTEPGIALEWVTLGVDVTA